jgi:hypothetical protein
MIPPSFRSALIGKRVAHTWQGYGSAVFLEFGALTERTRPDGSIGNPYGELSLMVEWSWRVEKARSILGGSCSSTSTWPGILRKLKNTRVVDVDVFGKLPEVSVVLSNGLRVTSFMTAEGQPAWSLISRINPRGSLSVSRGKLQVKSIAANHSRGHVQSNAPLSGSVAHHE